MKSLRNSDMDSFWDLYDNSSKNYSRDFLRKSIETFINLETNDNTSDKKPIKYNITKIKNKKFLYSFLKFILKLKTSPILPWIVPEIVPWIPLKKIPELNPENLPLISSESSPEIL